MRAVGKGTKAGGPALVSAGALALSLVLAAPAAAQTIVVPTAFGGDGGRGGDAGHGGDCSGRGCSPGGGGRGGNGGPGGDGTQTGG
ncbi:MAG: hypothetical protein ACRDZ7_13835, partial [Acidimicrobiia bacterium]